MGGSFSSVAVVALLAGSCAVHLDDRPGRLCDEASPCSLGRSCVAGHCREGQSPEPPDGGYRCDSAELETLPNLLPNPSFESSIRGWSEYHNATLQRVPGGQEGALSLEATGPTTPDQFGITMDRNTVADAGGPTARFCLGAWVRSEKARSPASLQLREYDPSGQQYGPQATSNSVALSTQWQHLSLEFQTTGPAGTFLYFQVVDENPSRVPGEAFQIDALELRKAW